ncbi:MAG: cytochrome c [Acidimicrobiia bacterium]|nr:cytochrome c [Acidimicrobiia bacterium]
MRRSAFAGIALALVGLLGACGGDPHPDVTKVRDPADVAAGAVIWEANCAACHGVSLEGGETPDGSKAPGLVSSELGHPDSDFVEIATNGKGKMPGFGPILTAEEIRQVVDHIRSVQAANLNS